MELTRLDDYMKSKSAGVSSLGLRQKERFLNQGGMSIPKDKLEFGEAGKRLYHLELALPFHPLTLEEDNFNLNNKFRGPGAPSNMVIYLKSKMREDAALHKHYADMGGMTPEQYDISTNEITEQDWDVFGRFRELLHYSELVQNAPKWGMYGTKFLSRAVMGEDKEYIEKDLGAELEELLRDLTIAKVVKINQEYEEGAKKNKPDEDRKKEIKAEWDNKALTKPYYAGVIRCLVFPLDADGEITIKDLTNLNNFIIKVYNG